MAQISWGASVTFRVTDSLHRFLRSMWRWSLAGSGHVPSRRCGFNSKASGPADDGGREGVFLLWISRIGELGSALASGNVEKTRRCLQWLRWLQKSNPVFKCDCVLRCQRSDGEDWHILIRGRFTELWSVQHRNIDILHWHKVLPNKGKPIFQDFVYSSNYNS